MKSYRRFFFLVMAAAVGVTVLQVRLILYAHNTYMDKFASDVTDALNRVSIKLEYDHAQEVVNRFDQYENGAVQEKEKNIFEQALVMRRLSRLDSVIQDANDRALLQEQQKLENRVNMSQIDSLLKIEFARFSLPTSYEFGIVEAEAPTRFTTIDFEWSENMDMFRTLLYRHDYPIASSTWLYLYFPGKSRFVLRRLILVISLSILLMGLLVFAMGRTVQQLIKQKEISNIKTDFINNMTHEFKTPIATISLAVDALSSDAISSDPQRIKYYADMIRQENRRMNAQVEQVLRLALLDRKAISFEKEAVDVHQLVEKAIAHLRLQVETRGGDFKTELNAKYSMIEVDPEQIITVLVNLIDNANKYSPNEPEISIRTFNKSEHVVIEVADKGLGMSKDLINKVFDRFFRQTTGDLHDIKGHGLGLSYAREIISLHNGLISVESHPGRGSVFSIYLPFIQED
jgi:two-component system, OmpR family, phosphate regulon sensor histidine kinase PhoR